MEGTSVILQDLIKQITACFSDDKPIDAIKKLKRLEKAVADGNCKDSNGTIVDDKNAKYSEFISSELVTELKEDNEDFKYLFNNLDA